MDASKFIITGGLIIIAFAVITMFALIYFGYKIAMQYEKEKKEEKAKEEKIRLETLAALQKLAEQKEAEQKEGGNNP